MAGRSTTWVGQTLDGRYAVTALLGEGGMGFVYRAYDNRLEGDVVVKVPRAELLADAEFRTRFQDEIRALVRMNHPHVVKVTDTGRHEGLPYAVMQFLPGGSLDDRRPKADDGRIKPMKVRSLKDWLPAVADALDYIHAQGYIHRDIKPANILFDGARNAYISDFGVAKAAGDTNRPNLTGAGMIVGTPEYVAPEIVHGKPFDGRADQYALGVMVYELIGGVQPFTAPSPMAVLIKHISEPAVPLSDFRESVSPALSNAVMRALAKDPGKRFPSCAAFAALAVAAADEPTGNYGVAKPAPGTGAAKRPGPRSALRWRAGVAAACVACLAVVLGIALISNGGSPPVVPDDTGGSPKGGTVPDPPPTIKPGTPAEHKDEPKPKPPDKADPPRPTKVIDIGDGQTMEFALIPAGTFRMGAPDGTGPATPAHEVFIERPFYVAKHEVTVRQFRAFVESDAYVTYAERDGSSAEGWNAERGELERKSVYTWKNPGFPQSDDHPVVCVTKLDAQAFHRWLFQKRRERFALPTEAQWEYACRAGSSNSAPTSLQGAANLLDRSLGSKLKPPRGEPWDDGQPFTARVGSFAANGFGLFDTHGNVAEWCADAARDYKKTAAPDPVGEDEFGAKHVVRGGSWLSPAAECAAYERMLLDDADTASCRIGFRLTINIQR